MEVCKLRDLLYSALISDFRRDVDKICALLGYYAASCGTTWHRVIPQKSADYCTVN
jgi:hypothetical protein